MKNDKRKIVLAIVILGIITLGGFYLKYVVKSNLGFTKIVSINNVLLNKKTTWETTKINRESQTGNKELLGENKLNEEALTEDSLLTKAVFNKEEIAGSTSLNRLMRGNEKFITAKSNASIIDKEARENLYKNGQKPYAVVLTCSDSRVVPENIFYTGLGEILVVRVVGNVVDDIVLGSIQFAIEEGKVPLIMVMGHQDCGAVQEAGKGHSTGNLDKLIKKIVPSYEKAKSSSKDKEDIVNKAVELNVKNSIEEIRKDKNIEKYLQENKVSIVGSIYSLQTGEVKLLENRG